MAHQKRRRTGRRNRTGRRSSQSVVYVRRSERGAAVFIVVVVLTMLTAVGLFAAKSASIATRSSGHMRQGTQAHYVTEFAMLTAMTELASPRRQVYIDQGKVAPAAGCEHATTVLKPNYFCYRFSTYELQEKMRDALSNGGFEFVDLKTGTTPGSLGGGDLDADMQVELSDLSTITVPIPGTDLSSPDATKMTYQVVTVSAFGQVRPYDADTSAAGTHESGSASIEVGRAQVIFGPMVQSQ